MNSLHQLLFGRHLAFFGTRNDFFVQYFLLVHMFAMEGESIDSRINFYFLVRIGMIIKLYFCRFRVPIFHFHFSFLSSELVSKSLLKYISNCYLMTMNGAFAVDIMYYFQMLCKLHPYTYLLLLLQKRIFLQPLIYIKLYVNKYKKHFCLP